MHFFAFQGRITARAAILKVGLQYMLCYLRRQEVLFSFRQKKTPKNGKYGKIFGKSNIDDLIMLILRSHFVNPFDLNWKCKHMRRKKEKPSFCHRFCLPPRPTPDRKQNGLQRGNGKASITFFRQPAKKQKDYHAFLCIQRSNGNKKFLTLG